MCVSPLILNSCVILLLNHGTVCLTLFLIYHSLRRPTTYFVAFVFMVRLSHAKFWNLICYQNHLQKGELLIHIFFIYQTLILSIGKITSTVDMFKIL